MGLSGVGKAFWLKRWVVRLCRLPSRKSDPNFLWWHSQWANKVTVYKTQILSQLSFIQRKQCEFPTGTFQGPKRHVWHDLTAEHRQNRDRKPKPCCRDGSTGSAGCTSVALSVSARTHHTSHGLGVRKSVARSGKKDHDRCFTGSSYSGALQPKSLGTSNLLLPGRNLSWT